MKTFLKQLIQIDKITHNLSNYAILFTLAVLTKYWIGLIVAITFSLLKEFVLDKWLKKGNFEIADLVSNGLGILEGTIMYILYSITI
jgi:hypothetical protein